jgi:hypothetical protein
VLVYDVSCDSISVVVRYQLCGMTGQLAKLTKMHDRESYVRISVDIQKAQIKNVHNEKGAWPGLQVVFEPSKGI